MNGVRSAGIPSEGWAPLESETENMEWFADFQFHDPGELTDRELTLVLVEKCPADPQRELVPEYRFEMRRAGIEEKVGHICLRVGLTPQLRRFGGHIGYGVDPPYRGRRFAARSCRLLFPLAQSHCLDPLLVTCGADNKASRRTCEIIGGQLVRTEIIEIEPGVWRPTCYYHVHPESRKGSDPRDVG